MSETRELREVFGVMRRDGGVPFGPPELDACRALAEADPSLMVVSYFATDWAEARPGDEVAVTLVPTPEPGRWFYANPLDGRESREAGA